MSLSSKLVDICENVSDFLNSFEDLPIVVGGFYTNFSNLPKFNRILTNPEFYSQKGISLEIISMTPDEYIEAVAKGFGRTVEWTEDQCKREKIDKYKKAFRTGHKFPIPLLVYNKVRSTFLQDGRHRAIAAKECGIKLIPVAKVVIEFGNELDLNSLQLKDGRVVFPVDIGHATID